MGKAMRTKRNSPVSRADVDDVDLASTDMRPGRVPGAAFAGCPLRGRRETPLQESGSVKVSLGDAVQITFATVPLTDDPAEA